jgi:hypothetical protein
MAATRKSNARTILRPLGLSQSPDRRVVLCRTCRCPVFRSARRNASRLHCISQASREKKRSAGPAFRMTAGNTGRHVQAGSRPVQSPLAEKARCAFQRSRLFVRQFKANRNAYSCSYQRARPSHRRRMRLELRKSLRRCRRRIRPFSRRSAHLRLRLGRTVVCRHGQRARIEGLRLPCIAERFGPAPWRQAV